MWELNAGSYPNQLALSNHPMRYLGYWAQFLQHTVRRIHNSATSLYASYVTPSGSCVRSSPVCMTASPPTERVPMLGICVLFVYDHLHHSMTSTSTIVARSSLFTLQRELGYAGIGSLKHSGYISLDISALFDVIKSSTKFYSLL